MTDEQIKEAAQRSPDRYILHTDADGVLVAFEDADSGFYWSKLPDGGWGWIA